MDELERIAAAEGALSAEDHERFRGWMSHKEMRLALADLDEALRAKAAALEEYERVREDFEAVLVMLDRAEERVRRAAKIAAGEE